MFFLNMNALIFFCIEDLRKTKHIKLRVSSESSIHQNSRVGVELNTEHEPVACRSPHKETPNLKKSRLIEFKWHLLFV